MDVAGSTTIADKAPSNNDRRIAAAYVCAILVIVLYVGSLLKIEQGVLRTLGLDVTKTSHVPVGVEPPPPQLLQLPIQPAWPVTGPSHSGAYAQVPTDGGASLPGLYNLARLPWVGRSFRVAVVGTLPVPAFGSGGSEEPAPGLRALLGEALGRTNIRFVAAAAGEAPDIVLVGSGGSASAVVAKEGRAAVVIAFAAAGEEARGPGPGADGTFDIVAAESVVVPPPTTDGRIERDCTLSTPQGRLQGLLRGPSGCAEGARPAPDGRTRGGGGDAWCAAARRSLLAMYVHALHRGDAKPTGRAVFATYGSTPAFDRWNARALAQAKAVGSFAEIHGFSQGDIDPAFKAAAPGVFFEGSRGDGYWSWKPHLMRRLMESWTHMAHGDVLLYSDSTNKILKAPKQYLDWAGESGALTFQMPLRASPWTKGATFAAMGADPAAFGSLSQCTATAVALRKDPFGLFVVTQWEWFAMDADAITDAGDGGVANPPDFKDHRHDQSIWNLLVYQLGLKVVRPTDETYVGTPEFIDRLNRYNRRRL